MNEDFDYGPPEGTGIVKVQALPSPEAHSPLGKTEVSRWRRFAEWLFPKLKTGAELGEVYVRGRAAQENNTARKTAEEATEIHSRAEHESIRSEVTRQEVVAKFTANLKAISELPEAQQLFAFAKMVEQNPGILEKVDEIQSLLARLSVTRCLSLAPVGFAKGTIAKLVKDRGFGFISGDEGEVFFFHSAVQGASFDELEEGQTVEYEIDENVSPRLRKKGPRAAFVKPV